MREESANLIESLKEYLITEEHNKRTYHLPESIAVRCDLSKIRKEFPQTTLMMDQDKSYNVLVIE
jgi:hypothetical protein